MLYQLIRLKLILFQIRRVERESRLKIASQNNCILRPFSGRPFIILGSTSVDTTIKYRLVRCLLVLDKMLDIWVYMFGA